MSSSTPRSSASGATSPGAPVPPARRRLLVVATAAVSALMVLVLLVAGLAVTEVILRAMKAPPKPGSLVLHPSLGWDRTPPWEKPIPATAAAAPGAKPLTILFIGDSFTHNTAWSRLTVEALNARGIAATGWEAGVSGYGQVQEWMKLRMLLPELNPDLVVLLFYGWNDPRDNCPVPGIIYTPEMMGRPYLAAGSDLVAEPAGFWMDVRGLEVYHQFFEGWWYRRVMSSSRRAMKAGGADAVAQRGTPELTIYTDPLTWMPLYQPSQQAGAYVSRAWEETRRAIGLVVQACRTQGCGLVVAGIDSPLTIDRDVFDAHVATSALYRADDFDTGLPLRRFAEACAAAGVTPVLPAPALARYAAKVNRKIYDGNPGDLSGHLLPDAQEVLAAEVADGIQAWLRTRAAPAAPSAAPTPAGAPPPP